jgi:hypothetical protein
MPEISLKKNMIRMISLIFFLIILSVFSLVIVDELEPFLKYKDRIGMGRKRLLRSKYYVIDSIIYIIWKVINCSPCFSYHLTWVVFLCLGSWLGFLLGFITFLITKILYLKVWNTISF